MTPEPSPGRALLGLLLVAVVAAVGGMVLFLPLFLWLPVWSPWRYATWAAAFVGPIAGAMIGEWLAQRVGCRPYQKVASTTTMGVVFAFLIASILPYLTRT